MKFSDFKVGSRLAVGFGALLLASLALGAVSWWRLAQIDAVVTRLATENWEKGRLTMEMESRTRDNAAKAARVMLDGIDAAGIEQLRAEMSENSKANSAALEKLEKLVYLPEGKALLAEAADARLRYIASRDEVNKLAAEPKTRGAALARFQGETMPALDAYVRPFTRLKELQQSLFDSAVAESQAAYRSARNTIIGASAVMLIFGMLLAWALTRGIVRPLRNAVDVADAVKSGRLDNHIDAGGRDETGQLLSSLDAMQSALRAREEKDADFRGQIAAINRAQAVIEFSMDGTVREVNENFAKVTGYSREEVVGKHHSAFCEAAYANSAEYRTFWAKLNRGEYDVGVYKRVGKGGREIWIQSSYNPIADTNGKFVKVVKYATDVTEQMARNADYAGQLAAIHRAQAVIEFDMDGSVRKINDNFARFTGYTEQELVGRHHRMFLEPSATGTAEYREFWAKLNRGEADIGYYKRVVKGGREVWIQASYNPIPDANGKPFKVVKYASDVTAQMQAQQMLQAAVAQTQSAVKFAADGDLTHRIPMDGKTGDLEALCRGVNALLDSTTELVKQVKTATGEVQAGAQEISKGNTNLSQRTEEQASSLEETASSMEEMTSTVKQTADNAGQANQLAMAARQQAEKGGSVVSSAVQAMSGINEASKKIADIIGVIDEIAFQTNLLALNAAVEAARAGEQGRGFAVVATEVRNLAGRSATAAKEIKALIVDSVARVEQGSKLVDESGKSLEEIVGAVKKVTDIVAEIAAASREQSSGIEQVNKAVMQMDTTTQQNAALVEEAAAASQAIVEQAQALNGLVARYNVGDGGNVRAAVKSSAVPAVDRRGKDRPWSGSPSAAKAGPARVTPPVARKAVVNDSSEWSEF
jgi:methyl-accepting chemotaxis protein